MLVVIVLIYYQKTKNVTFFAMVSSMRNTTKDVKTEINNTICVKLEDENAKTLWR